MFIPSRQMPTSDPHVRAYLQRLVSVPAYAKREGISLVQAHRRISEGKVETETIANRVFVVLPDSK